MLLGKRSSPPMKRTASSMEFPAGVLFDVEAPQPVVQDGSISGQLFDLRWGAEEVGQRSPSRYAGSMPSPRGRLGGAVDFSGLPGTESFLRACGLCNRSLGPGRDAYIYRGEIAFCSLECRQQRINLDERKEKRSPNSSATKGDTSGALATS
ncbi:FCS-Like Zinc finger 7-like [Curcuma longa]|uniref:FCS-Like Zinc finger 7-like n=1 Tax=Curcuma longa TaxID=136217 RepID=UPI003D9EC7F8